MAKRNGIREWVFQRVSNVMIFAYGIFYITMVLSMGDVNYADWVAMHSGAVFKIVSSVVLVVTMLNSLLAGWQIGTDYTQKVSIPGFGF
ncbi:MAG: succinate dehydrogenase, hydrophobic membrane anchor protein, partial [Pseudomonadota bacterium]